MNKDSGGPAFPVREERDRNGDIFQYASAGMTLRDHFAAKSMVAQIGTAAGPVMGGFDGFQDYIAKAAYQMADAMLKAREL